MTESERDGDRVRHREKVMEAGGGRRGKGPPLTVAEPMQGTKCRLMYYTASCLKIKRAPSSNHDEHTRLRTWGGGQG